MFAYLIFLTGLGAMVTRLFPKYHWLHNWLGKFYIMFMLWGTATAMIIHNTGLPVGVLLSFLWVNIGLSVGWIAITVHMNRRRSKKSPNQSSEADNEDSIAAAPGTPEKSRWRKIWDRMTTLKAFHGCIMFVSWINVAGRVFATPGLGQFDCYTYPVYKPLKSVHFTPTTTDNVTDITFVPFLDPNYKRLPWANFEGGWAALMLLGMYALAFLVGWVYLMCKIKSSTGSSSSSAAVAAGKAKDLSAPGNADDIAIPISTQA